MELIRCSNGHEYDPAISRECPECARLGNKTVPLMDGIQFDDYGKTEPVRPVDAARFSGVGRTQPVNYDGQWAEQDNYRNGGKVSDDYQQTMPIHYEEDAGMGAQLPVAGWMVCIDGPSKGTDYRIHEENNYIGRSNKMDICILGDPTISRENHAIITYDPRDRVFYFAPQRGASIVRVNGRAVLSTVELHSYDRIEIGKSMFLFVAFCGEQFQWGE